jgi:recombination protein RecT
MKEGLKDQLKGKTSQTELMKSPTMAGMKTGEIKAMLELYKGQIAQALPKHLTAERIIQLGTTLIARTPKLAECTKESIIGALMQSSMLGLEPIPILGEAYLIPFKNNTTQKMEAQFLIGYKGYLTLARNTGEVLDIYAENVFTNDEFKIVYGLNRDIIHNPALGERGTLTGSYAVIKYKNSGFDFEYLTKLEIEKIRGRSKAADSKYSPWSNPDDYPEMCKKTVIRRLAKRMPKAIQKQMVTDGAVLNIDSFQKDGEIDLNTIEPADVVNEKSATAADRDILIGILDAQAKQFPAKVSDLLDKKGYASVLELQKAGDQALTEFVEELQK